MVLTMSFGFALDAVDLVLGIFEIRLHHLRLFIDTKLSSACLLGHGHEAGTTSHVGTQAAAAEHEDVTNCDNCFLDEVGLRIWRAFFYSLG